MRRLGPRLRLGTLRVNIGSYRDRQTTLRRPVLAKGQFFATFFGLSCLRMSGSNPSVVTFGVVFTPAENSTLMSPSQQVQYTALSNEIFFGSETFFEVAVLAASKIGTSVGLVRKPLVFSTIGATSPVWPVSALALQRAAR